MSRPGLMAPWLLLLVTGMAPAQDVSPGLWELSLDARVEQAPDWAPAPFKLTQCLTVSDAQDPSRVLGPMATPGASGCTYTEKSYAGSSFRFSMQCAGLFNLKTQGEVSFSGNEMSGTMTTVGSVGGEQTEFRSRISGRRIGGC